MKKILLLILLLSLSIFIPTILFSNNIDSWSTLSTNPMEVRNNSGMLVYNGQIYIIAGSDGTTYYKDVYRSSNGINWYSNTKNAQFGGRENFATFNYNFKMWVVGGNDAANNLKDVWSSYDGTTWTSNTLNAQFGERTKFLGYTTHKNYMYIIGGFDGSTYPKDVYRSANGSDWSAVTKNAEFSGGMKGTLVSDGVNLYLMGGDNGSGTYYNTIWKSTNDGVSWTNIGTANFGERSDFSYGYVNGKMYISSGYDGSAYLNDTWYSNNFINWTQDLDYINTISNTSSIVFNNKWFMFGGYDGSNYYNDVVMAQFSLGTPTITPTIQNTYTPTITSTITVTSTDTIITLPTDTPTTAWTQQIDSRIIYMPTPEWTQQTEISITNLTPYPTQVTTIWVSMINWPTLIPTLTYTNTVTQTPTSAITPYATYQPIIRYVASESDGYKNGMKVEFNKVTGTGDYSGINYNLRVKDLTYPNNTYSINLSNATDTTNALSGWITYDLTNLRYDYCYDIYLDISHPSWSATIGATPITLCPFETPTAFIGTPTASNTPDCSPPTATPTPQVTIVQTVTGKVAFFNPTAQPTNAIVDLTGSGYTWGTVSGVSATVRSLDGIFGWNTNAATAGDNNAGLMYVTNTASTIFIQELYTATGAGDRQVIVRQGAATIGTWFASWITNSWQGATYTNFQALAPFDFTANRWYRRTISYDYKPDTTTRVNEYIVIDNTTNTISSAQANSAVRLALTPPYIAVWALDTRGAGGTTGFITAHNLIAKSRYIKVVLPAIGYKVEILDGSDAEILCAETDISGIATMDGLNFKWGDFTGKIRITTPNGWVHTSDLMDICVGDVFTITLI